jgi:hypothetical protein
MYRAPVHATTRSTLQTFFPDFDEFGRGGGWILLTQDTEGRYVSYMHLEQAYFTTPGTQLAQGQLIAKSGDTGSPGAFHLHFERSADPLLSPRQPVDLEPVSGTTSFALGTPYKSDNAGIGDVCTSGDQGPGWTCTESLPILGFHYWPFVNAFNSQGGYNGPGVPWDPCGGGNAGCWWVHTWPNAFTGRNDATQDFKGGPNQGTGALMRRQDGCSGCWSPNVYWIHGDIWLKYVALGGAGWPGLGYPTSNEIAGSNARSGTPYRRTQFQAGTIVWWATTAVEYEVHGAIWLTYQGMGGPAWSVCGLPTQDEVPWGPGGAISLFQYGYIYWNGSSAQVGCP